MGTNYFQKLREERKRCACSRAQADYLGIFEHRLISSGELFLIKNLPHESLEPKIFELTAVFRSHSQASVGWLRPPKAAKFIAKGIAMKLRWNVLRAVRQLAMAGFALSLSTVG